MTALDWLEQRGRGAPAPLVARVRHYVGADDAGGDPARQLARAGVAALTAALRSPGDRRAALDLLAADGLVTLALLVRAESDPATLAGLAAEIQDTSLDVL